MRKSNKHLYVGEVFFPKAREYRLHCTKDGCFYTCRKMLKSGADKKWLRNDSNCVWVVEENALFDKPVNWEAIEAECVKALHSIGLDIGCFDVKVKYAKDKEGRLRPNPDFIIIESGSAPSFGSITVEKYMEIIPKLIISKYNNNYGTNSSENIRGSENTGQINPAPDDSSENSFGSVLRSHLEEDEDSSFGAALRRHLED